MKKGLTEIVFILDRSGSMHGLEADTIGGFNSMMEKQKKDSGDDGEAYVSTVLFDDFSRVHRRGCRPRGSLSVQQEGYRRLCFLFRWRVPYV